LSGGVRKNVAQFREPASCPEARRQSRRRAARSIAPGSRARGFASVDSDLAELPRLEALKEPPESDANVEELNGFFRWYAFTARN
jgi:hypothetical protein